MYLLLNYYDPIVAICDNRSNAFLGIDISFKYRNEKEMHISLHKCQS